MPDRLDQEIVRLAEESARKPDYAAVLARGAALSRRRTASALVATVVVVAGMVGLTQVATRPRAVPVVPVQPSPSPTATESPEPPESPEPNVPEPARRTAQEIVDDPESRLVEVHSVPGDPGTSVALWRCSPESCRGRGQALTLFHDGATTPVVPSTTWSNALVRIAADGDAVVLEYRRQLAIQVVRPDGSVAPVDMVAADAPVAGDEVLLGQDIRKTTWIFWATDTKTLKAHTVPVPEDTQNLVQTASGQLRALTSAGGYAWSDDGGTTWTERPGAVQQDLLPGLVSSLDNTHVVVGGGDGATLFPFQEIRRLDGDASWVVATPPDDPMALIGRRAVLPDGRFVVSVVEWSDNGRYDKPLQGTPPGIYVSYGADWSTYTRVESGAPFETPARQEPMVTDIRVSDAGTFITAIGPDWSSAWTSDDLGATWREMRVR